MESPIKRLLICGLTLAAFSGCASLPPSHFANSAPRLDPEKFFAGRTHSWGVFENPSGRPTRTFTTEAVGRMQGRTLLLSQKFTYGNGETQSRQWRIRRLDAHRYEATANDVMGVAKGTAYGSLFSFEYTVALKPGNPLIDVTLKQWMYLQPDGTIVNRATITKLGLILGMVTEYFQRTPSSGR